MSRNPVQNAALDWAEGAPSGDDSLWARFDYLKLRQTLEAIVAAMEATPQVELPPTEAEADGTLRLLVSNDHPKKGENSPSDGPADQPRESSD
ncbi:MAG TPA: hypothetical protein VFQ31_08220 [Methyloceanibacter sp.]|nr:hypothetical protein [Methyloceanibacter sp.]